MIISVEVLNGIKIFCSTQYKVDCIRFQGSCQVPDDEQWIKKGISLSNIYNVIYNFHDLQILRSVLYCSQDD